MACTEGAQRPRVNTTSFSAGYFGLRQILRISIVVDRLLRSLALLLPKPHDSANVVPSPEPVDGWRRTVRKAITIATAPIASAT